jgi:hypothetical protein
MHWKIGWRWFCLVGLMTLAGCHSLPGKPIAPTYAGVGAQEARQILIERASAIRNFTGQCDVTLSRADGQSVRLNGVIIFAAPNRLRLRVWKLIEPVIDLTLRADGLWIETSDDAKSHGAMLPPSVGSDQVTESLTWLRGGFFSTPGLMSEATKNAILFRQVQKDGTKVDCVVDRPTATAREFRVLDARGKLRFTLMLSDYRDISGVVWPLRIRGWSANKSEGGVIEIVFSDIEFNGELPPRAFDPPRDAERRP